MVHDQSHVELCKNNGWLLNEVQLRVLKVVLKWRDVVARMIDESPRFVLPNRGLQALANHMPTDAYGLICFGHGDRHLDRQAEPKPVH